MIINRENSIQAGLDKKTIPLISGDEDSYSAQAIYPICCEGDCIGAVILYSRENQTHFSETEYKAAACAASFLGKQMGKKACKRKQKSVLAKGYFASLTV